MIFSLGMVGSPLPIWLFKADFLAQIAEQGMPADYVAAVEALSSNAMLIVLFVAPIIGGIIGGGVIAAAACHQGQRHDERKEKCKKLLHLTSFLLLD